MKSNRLSDTQRYALCKWLDLQRDFVRTLPFASLRKVMSDTPEIDFAVTESNLRHALKTVGVTCASAKGEPARDLDSDLAALAVRVSSLESAIDVLSGLANRHSEHLSALVGKVNETAARIR